MAAALSGAAAGTEPETATPAPIVVGVDGSACSRQAVAWAAAEARCQGRGLELLYVQPTESPLDRTGAAWPGGTGGREAVQTQAARLLADGVPTRTVLADGEPGQVLVRR